MQAYELNKKRNWLLVLKLEFESFTVSNACVKCGFILVSAGLQFLKVSLKHFTTSSKATKVTSSICLLEGLNVLM